MKGKKHTAEQIIEKLREADALLASGKSIAEISYGTNTGKSGSSFKKWY